MFSKESATSINNPMSQKLSYGHCRMHLSNSTPRRSTGLGRPQPCPQLGEPDAILTQCGNRECLVS